LGSEKKKKKEKEDKIKKPSAKSLLKIISRQEEEIKTLELELDETRRSYESSMMELESEKSEKKFYINQCNEMKKELDDLKTEEQDSLRTNELSSATLKKLQELKEALDNALDENRRLNEALEKSSEIPTPQPKKKVGRKSLLTEELNEKILALKAQGLSLRKIAAQLNITRSLVERALNLSLKNKAESSENEIK
jgi:DNA-binding CsgD family transcriptional regulator